MRRILLISILGALVATPGSAQYTAYTPRTPDETALVKLEDLWCDAAIKRDSAGLDSVFADDIIWLTDTTSLSKPQILDLYLRQDTLNALRLSEVVIRIFGSTAVVTSHVHVTYTEGGKDGADTHASTDVFVKRKGRWWLVST